MHHPDDLRRDGHGEHLAWLNQAHGQNQARLQLNVKKVNTNNFMGSDSRAFNKSQMTAYSTNKNNDSSIFNMTTRRVRDIMNFDKPVPIEEQKGRGPSDSRAR